MLRHPAPTTSGPLLTEPAQLSARFIRALGVAARLHDGQRRKGTRIPYISHPLGTCSIALEYGADEDQASAALLHDVLEDVEPAETARAEVARFGPEVLRIVEACTDTDARPKPAWRSRKLAYLARLANQDRAVLLVSASDKLHNARAIVRDLREEGEKIWDRFSHSKDQTLWNYRSLVAAYRANPTHDPALIDELERTVSEMERLGNLPQASSVG